MKVFLTLSLCCITLNGLAMEKSPEIFRSDRQEENELYRQKKIGYDKFNRNQKFDKKYKNRCEWPKPATKSTKRTPTPPRIIKQ